MVEGANPHENLMNAFYFKGMNRSRTFITLGVLSLGASVAVVAQVSRRSSDVQFIGGYFTDPRDHGRPVALVAGALGVPPQVFRDAFSGVHPAPGGERPDPADVRRNKQVLLDALGPYGVTNERLDEVSNFYRYRPQNGESWPHRAAVAELVKKNGVVVGVKIVDGGFGYSSPPSVSIKGHPEIVARASLSFSKDFKKNGAVSGVTLLPQKGR